MYPTSTFDLTFLHACTPAHTHTHNVHAHAHKRNRGERRNEQFVSLLVKVYYKEDWELNMTVSSVDIIGSLFQWLPSKERYR